MKHPGGRPREFDAVVSVRLPADLHDQLAQVAVRDQRDLSDVIRERLSGSFVSQNPRAEESTRHS